MEKIHSTAIIDPSAEIAEDVQIGPFTIIGPDVKIKSGTVIHSHVVIEGHTEIGSNCKIATAAVIGTAPQDLSYKGEPTQVIVGDNTVIREYVTINRASGEGGITSVGSDCMLMAYTHLAHNCKVGNKVLMANYTGLAGHVEVDNNAFIGGITAIHQFVKVGRNAIISGFSGTRQDIPPYSITDGRPAIIRGVNKIGLRRNGFSRAQIDNMRKAFKIIFFEKHTLSNSLEMLPNEVEMDEHVLHLVDFMKNSKRGVRLKRDNDDMDEI